jgi:hypothetical protein
MFLTLATIPVSNNATIITKEVIDAVQVIANDFILVRYVSGMHRFHLCRLIVAYYGLLILLILFIAAALTWLLYDVNYSYSFISSENKF